jgi:hypothetical protein
VAESENRGTGRGLWGRAWLCGAGPRTGMRWAAAGLTNRTLHPASAARAFTLRLSGAPLPHAAVRAAKPCARSAVPQVTVGPFPAAAPRSPSPDPRRRLPSRSGILASMRSVGDQVRDWHQGVQAVARGDWDGALCLFSGVLEPPARMCFNVGCVHLLAGDPEAALRVSTPGLTAETPSLGEVNGEGCVNPFLPMGTFNPWSPGGEVFSALPPTLA